MAMTTDQSAALMQSPDFRGRIQVCAVKYADSIRSSGLTTMGHVGLGKWADSVFLSPMQVATQLQSPVVMDAAVQLAGVDAQGKALVDDASLQSAVEATVNKTI